jgi:hypothetical protein
MDDKLHIDCKFDKKFPYYGWKVSTTEAHLSWEPWFLENLAPLPMEPWKFSLETWGSSYGSMRTWVQLPMQT